MIAGRFITRTLTLALTIVIAVVMVACSSKSSTTTSSTTTQTAAVRLVFTMQPVGAEAGSVFVTAPSVAAVDANDNVVTGARVLVQLEITADTDSKTPTLYGGTTAALVNGVIDFPGLSMRKAGTFTLTASGEGLSSAVSEPFETGPTTGASIHFSNTVVGARAGEPFVAQPEVTVLDMYGNVATTSTAEVSLSLIIDPYNIDKDGVLTGVAKAVPVNGVVRFEGLSIDKKGNYFLRASSIGMPVVISGYFDITHADPVKLVFTTQPKTSPAGSPLTINPPAIAVVVKDKYGNTVSDYVGEVTVSITPGTGTPEAVLAGETTESVNYGAAGFQGLSVDKVGTGYTLTATSPGLEQTVSDSFDITPEEATTTTETSTTTTEAETTTQ